MITDIGGALRWARLLFREKNTEQGFLDAELLLAYTLGVERHIIHRDPDTNLTADQWCRFRQLVLRRLEGEPVAYLVGEREFMGLSFKVDHRVLIPRPETELLVETALVLLGGPRLPTESFVSLSPVPKTGIVADIGTGSGAIALSLAYYNQEIEVYAVDISSAALEVARQNAVRLGISSRVNFALGNLLDPLQDREIKGRLSLITANLPYVTTVDMECLPRDVRDYEPHIALDGGSDGLDFYRRLIPEAVEYLAPGGCLLMEIGPGQGGPLKKLFPPGCSGQVVNDLAGRERMVVLVNGEGDSGHSKE